MFKERVKNGKAYICSRHFDKDDIQKTSKKSVLKFGALPTKNLPQKSHPTKTPAPRKQIVKYEVPVKLKKTIQISSTMDIVQQFDKLAKSNWRMESDEKKQALHFLYYKNFMHQHIPDVSLFITQEEKNSSLMLHFVVELLHIFRIA